MTDILQLAAKGDASQVLRDMRVRALWSPYYFVKMILGYRELTTEFHMPEMERFVNVWSQDVATKYYSKQAVEWARGFFKTTCFTIGTSIWVVCPVTDEDSEYAVNVLKIPEGEWRLRTSLHDQDATQLLAFETETNAKKKVGIIKWHFEENELFRSVFPEIAYTGKEPVWNNNCLRIRRVGQRQSDAEGTFEAIGVGGALQSRHYKIVWEDDLVGEKARKSGPVMDSTIGWHGRLSGAFENAAQQIRFLISNCWGYADLNGYVRHNEPDFTFHTRSAIENDEAVFPQRYTIDRLIAIRDSASMTRYDFACQYLNKPTLPGEQRVDLKLLHTYTVEEDGSMVCRCGARWRLSQCNRYLQYDPYNAKGVGSTSCPAIGVIACAPDKHVFLVDYWTTKGDYGQIFARIYKFNDVYRPAHFTYEDVGHQNMTGFHIQEEAKTAEYKKKHKNFPRIIPCPTHGVNRDVRISEALIPLIERGLFSYRTRQLDFYSQLETFPNKVLDHDYDILDMIVQGTAHWRYPENVDMADRSRAEEEEYLRHFNQPYMAGFNG